MIPATKAYISLEGGGEDKSTIIEWKWNDAADHPTRPDRTGRPLGTFGFATFAISSYFIAKNTFLVSQF